MEIWQILGIEPTQEQRAIKRAYAIKLKQLDIAQQPLEFQQLHQAYKEAVNLIDVVDELESVGLADSALAAQSDNHLSEQVADAATTHMSWFQQAQQIIADQQQLNQESSWHFLLDAVHELSDRDFKALGNALFIALAEHDIQASRRSLRTDKDILHFLDSIFHWSDRLELFSENVEEDALNLMEVKLKAQPSRTDPIRDSQGLKGTLTPRYRPLTMAELIEKCPASLEARGIAMILDLLLLVVAFIYWEVGHFSANFLMRANSDDWRNYSIHFFLIFAVYFLAAEVSPLGRSLGKLVCGIKVVIDPDLKWCGPCQLLLRQLLFLVPALISFGLMQINGILGVRVFELAYIVVAGGILNGWAPHDQLARTQVVNLRYDLSIQKN